MGNAGACSLVSILLKDVFFPSSVMELRRFDCGSLKFHLQNITSVSGNAYIKSNNWIFIHRVTNFSTGVTVFLFYNTNMVTMCCV